MHHTAGVEVTTGPLGQGFANGVGMGIAERWLRARFGAELCDHHTFVICSDGDLEEGISHEAASLAGHLGLGRLVYVYDDNHISIDGPTELALSDDAGKRFEAYGWHVDRPRRGRQRPRRPRGRPAAGDGRGRRTVAARSCAATSATRRPKYTDTDYAHGNPLGEDEIRVTKEILGLPPDETFYVPDDVLAFYRERGPSRAAAPARRGRSGSTSGPDHAAEWEACLGGTGLPGLGRRPADAGARARRSPPARRAARASRRSCRRVPGLVGGGADLTGNTGTAIKDQGVHVAATSRVAARSTSASASTAWAA